MNTCTEVIAPTKTRKRRVERPPTKWKGSNDPSEDDAIPDSTTTDELAEKLKRVGVTEEGFSSPPVLLKVPALNKRPAMHPNMTSKEVNRIILKQFTVIISVEKTVGKR
ncbi:uncharacterized protein LOC125036218 [Penaeus chinensis]|uniref:uncharacterized protein LOC125036218 n=1 Tax=Penaeus chinensis TaxID=139456 RepID=UPI001FB7CA74|nr:uncharacterized protein LOC125036218 [Penaeus chinensis]